MTSGFPIPQLCDWITQPSTYAAPVAHSPGGRGWALPQIAGVHAGGLRAWAVGSSLVAVLIVLLPGVNLTTGDQPLLVALSTGHRALRREGLRERLGQGPGQPPQTPALRGGHAEPANSAAKALHTVASACRRPGLPASVLLQPHWLAGCLKHLLWISRKERCGGCGGSSSCHCSIYSLHSPHPGFPKPTITTSKN